MLNRSLALIKSAIALGCVLTLWASCGVTVSLAANPQDLQLAYQQAITAVDRSVVRIETVGGQDLVGEDLTSSGATTGCVVREDGYIITSSFNFISKPSSILVTLWDEQRFAAEVIASDESRMLTLLKINTTGLVPLVAVPESELRVGQWTLAVGRTLDPKFPNASVGILSAVNRVWGKAVQTDSKTSPLNYGGPLIDLTGRCIGIIVPLSPDAQGLTAGVEWYDSGIGFAIPYAHIETILPRLTEKITLKPGLMGVGFEDKGPVSGSPKAMRVRPESPAAIAGIKIDDVIVEMNGQPIEKLNDFKHIIGSLYANENVSLKVRRGEETLEMSLTLAEQLKAYQFPYLGILPTRDYSETAATVVLRDVLPNSPAATAGLKKGDQILKVGTEAVTNWQNLSQKLRAYHPVDDVDLTIQRDGMEQVISTQLGELTAAPPTQLEPFLVTPPRIPARERVGRTNDQLPGEGLKYWYYVPENYRPDLTWGLLVWLHPTGEPLESEAIRAWSEVCRDRGIIIVGPRTPDVGGWNASHLESINEIVTKMRADYRIAPERVVVMGRDSSGPIATQLAFKYREQVRGLVLLGTLLRMAPPDADPAFPLEIIVTSDSESPTHERSQKIAEALINLKIPNWHIEVPGKENPPFTDFVVQNIGRWLDALEHL